MSKLSGVILLLLCSIMIALFSSCNKVHYVPVESVRTDSVKVYQLLRDSIYLRDSIHVKEKGDTIYINRYKYLYIDKVRVDTMYVTKVDSINVPYPVEKQLSRWQKIKLHVGGIAICLIFVCLILLLLRK